MKRRSVAPPVLLCCLCLLLLYLAYGEARRNKNTDSRFFFEAQRRGIRHKRKMVDAVFLWPNKTIPYTFLEPSPDRAAVLSGVQHWQQHTCLQFVHTKDLKQPHVAFRKLSGCRSGVGREMPLGQNVSIGDTCTRLGIVVHEIGHAIGFYHEIRRPDRDSHVIINSANILEEELFNFHKLQWIDTSVKYDLSSVMHYTPMEWTANGRTSVATRDPMLQGVLGTWKGTSHRGLSHRDKLLANTVYDCIGTWLAACGLQEDPCEGEGYLGAACRCVCPPGTAGLRCQHAAGGYYDDLLSPCSQTVSYDTIIRSPNYPYKYDKETWCVWVLHSDQCRAPVLTLLDFDFGPRDSRRHCTFDYLEIRTNSSSDGEVKCEKEVPPGTQFRAVGHTMILYFNGELGGYRGFEARLKFENIPGCCRRIVNGTETHWLSPGYPERPKAPFKCSVQLHKPDPAKLEVFLQHPERTSQEGEECPLQLCLPQGTCIRHCIAAKDDIPVAVLPNSGSTHILSGSAATHLTIKAVPTPCHQVIQLGGSGERAGAVEVLATNPGRAIPTMCEYRFQSATEEHVMLVVQKVLLSGSSALLAVDEGGSGEYHSNSTRSYSTGDFVPRQFISANSSIAVALQGGSGTHLTLQYFLYECADEEEECEYWKLDGECQRNSNWMSQHCPASCFVCNVTRTCLDRHLDCAFWAQHGQCEDNGRWMAVHCTAACGHCPSCEDLNPQCGAWAESGECDTNAPYMKLHCPASCNVCERPSEVKKTSLTTSKPDTTSALDVAGNPEHRLRSDSNATVSTDLDQTNIEEDEIFSGVLETNDSTETNETSKTLKGTSSNVTTKENDVDGENVNKKGTSGEIFRKKLIVTKDVDLATMNEVEEFVLLEDSPPLVHLSNYVVKENTDKFPAETPGPTPASVSAVPRPSRRVNTPRSVKRFRNFHRQTPSSSNSWNRRMWTAREPFWGTGDRMTLEQTSPNRHPFSVANSTDQRITPSSPKINFSDTSNLAYKLKKNELRNKSSILTPSHFNDVTFGIIEHSLPNHSKELDRKRVSFSIDIGSSNSLNQSTAASVERKYRKRWPLNLDTPGLRSRSSKLIGNQAGFNHSRIAETANITQANLIEVQTNSTECFDLRCSQNSSSLGKIVSNLNQKREPQINSTSNKEKLHFIQYLGNISVRNAVQSGDDNSTEENSSVSLLDMENDTLSFVDLISLDRAKINEGKALPSSTTPSTYEQEMDVQKPENNASRPNQNSEFAPNQENANEVFGIEGKLAANQLPNIQSTELRSSPLPAQRDNVPTTMSTDNEPHIPPVNTVKSVLTPEMSPSDSDSPAFMPTSFGPRETLFPQNSKVPNPLTISQSHLETNSGESLNVQTAHPFAPFIQPITSSTTVTSPISSALPTVSQPSATTQFLNRSRVDASTTPSPIMKPENIPSAFKLTQGPWRTDRGAFGNRRFPPRASNYDSVGRGLGAGHFFRRKQEPRAMSPVRHPARHGYLTENDVMFPAHQYPAADNQSQAKDKLHHNNVKRERLFASMTNEIPESAGKEGNATPHDVPQKQSQSLSLGSSQRATPNPLLWSAERRHLVSHGRSRRNYIKFIKAFKNKEAVIDSFMMLPFCSDIKRLERRSLSSLHSSARLSNHIKNSKKSYRRRLKLYRMLKRILNPRFPTGVTQNEPILNWYFKNKLRRTLRRLYRMRKERLRQYLFFNQNLSLRQLRRHGKKKKLKRYIRKYHLHKIFRLYRIRIINTHYNGFRNQTSSSRGANRSPILCMAIRKSTSKRVK